MAKFDIYIEGHEAQGSSSKAKILACGVEAETFTAAVRKWYNAIAEISDAKRMYGELDITDGIASLWGCRLFDNYRDAAKSFG